MKNVLISPPFQTPFKITTNCDDLVHLLKLKHGKYLTASWSHDAKNITAIKKGNSYSITFSNKMVQDKSGVLAIDEIMFNNTTYDPNIFAIHGAAVEWQGKAYLFLASTTSGKSTLTSYRTLRMTAFCWTEQALPFIRILRRSISGTAGWTY